MMQKNCDCLGESDLTDGGSLAVVFLLLGSLSTKDKHLVKASYTQSMLTA
jgi:hypothetical protein